MKSGRAGGKSVKTKKPAARIAVQAVVGNLYAPARPKRTRRRAYRNAVSTLRKKMAISMTVERMPKAPV